MAALGWGLRGDPGKREREINIKVVNVSVGKSVNVSGSVNVSVSASVSVSINVSVNISEV